MKNRKNDDIDAKKGEIVIYRSKSGGIRLEVKLEKETVWLTQAQKELDRKSVCSILEHTAKDGKRG